MPKVPQIDCKSIFEKAAGRSAEVITRTIVYNPDGPGVDNNVTSNGVRKPGSFAIRPSRRHEQLFV